MSVLHPVTEAHLCQLAALENFADHGVFVKFGMDEAVQLEARALDLAVQQSAQDAELTKCADLSLSARGLQQFDVCKAEWILPPATALWIHCECMYDAS